MGKMTKEIVESLLFFACVFFLLGILGTGLDPKNSEAIVIALAGFLFLTFYMIWRR